MPFHAVVSYLETVNLGSAIAIMAMLNAACAKLYDRNRFSTDKDLQHLGALMAFLFGERARKRAADVFIEHRDQSFQPLAPLACAAMTELCLRLCPLEGGRIFHSPAEDDTFGRALLSFQEHLLPEEMIGQGFEDFRKIPDDHFRYLARNHLGANLDLDFAGNLRRQAILFAVPEVSRNMVRRLKTSAPDWFLMLAGITPDEYQVLLIMFAMAHSRFTLEKPDLAALRYRPNELIANLRPAAQENFLRLHSLAEIDVEALRKTSLPESWEEAVYGQHLLLRRQILAVGPAKNCVVLHTQFLLEKFLHGPVHVLTDFVQEFQPAGWSIKRLRSDLGYLYEGYVQWLLELLLGPTCSYHFNFHIDGNRERDAMVVVGSDVLVCEITNHVLSLQERARCSPMDLAKIVKDDVERAFELARRVAQDGVTFGERRIQSKRAVPIVVVPEALPISEALSDRFIRALLDEGVPSGAITGVRRVLPVQIMTIAQLEGLDTLWPPPKREFRLITAIAHRAHDRLQRFSRAALGKPAKIEGYTLAKYGEQAQIRFREFGKSLFKSGGDAT